MESMDLTQEARKILLKYAHQTIEQAAHNPDLLRTLDWLDHAAPRVPGGDRPAAVFVTLMREGKLRGCVGTVSAETPLVQTVGRMALQSAFEDPRFPPLSEEELSGLSVELSVLSPMRRVASPNEIEPGKHGVHVRRGGRSGLFLPQVWEELPEKEAFMTELCMGKARLDPDAWRDPSTEISVFTVEHFGDAEP